MKNILMLNSIQTNQFEIAWKNKIILEFYEKKSTKNSIQTEIFEMKFKKLI